MPELPEVETIRRQLEPDVVGRRIESVRVLDERWTRPLEPRRLERIVAGRLIESIERRGKWLLVRLEGDRTLVMHLRMTGNLLLVPPEPAESEEEATRHLRAILHLDDGSELWFTDARRFGHAAVLDDRELEEFFITRVGLEPLSEELTPEALCHVAAGRTAPLKSFLLNQAGVAGIGNIYADEALWRARLHPLSPAGSMRKEHCEDLCEGIVDALEAGLAHGGSSIDDYRDARGERGSMQDEFLVHTREGEPCVRCGETIRRIVVTGRSTYFCPGCQKRLRRRRAPRRRVAASRA
jgi:formamidopyrimidine-DNA glycosylase